MAQSFDTFSEVFKEEARELLFNLETLLLELEDNPFDKKLIANIFRSMHTIKGSSAMFDFKSISDFTHDIENIFDLVRQDKIGVTKKLIDLTLAACDQIKKMLNSSDTETDRTVCNNITVEFKTLTAVVCNEKPEEVGIETSMDMSLPPPVLPDTSKEQEKQMTVCHIKFNPHSDIFKSGTNPLYLLDELNELGHYNIMASFNLPDIYNIDPEICYTSWDILLMTDGDIEQVKDVFVFVEDNCDVSIEMVEEDININGNIADTSEKQIEEEAILRTETEGEKTLPSSDIGKQISDLKTKFQQDELSTVKVSSEKLDRLMALVGEMVINQAQLRQMLLTSTDLSFRSVVKKMESLTVDLRDTSLSMRMIPIGTIFGKFKRLVRDLSKELGKEIDMITEGAETELDKTLIERLNDPLVHLIRNSIDHGIELPHIREKKGKPAKGTIKLTALHEGSNVLIIINDDGGGLDKKTIYNKAIEKGLITGGTELSEKDIFKLILMPGFSTATEVTSISGRGVGMDVVKQSIETLGGTLDITSIKDEGTSITMKLPLTLAIIEGLLACIGDDFFIFPLSVVERHVELTQKDIDRAHGRHIIEVRKEVLPYIKLRESFDISTEINDIEEVVITRANGKRIGFVVDRVIGIQQTVIKSLGKVYKHIKGLSGATILGDGTVGLILDVHQLVNDEMEKELN
jgi:two-component system chemotaxis sensor kinase CheA